MFGVVIMLCLCCFLCVCVFYGVLMFFLMFLQKIKDIFFVDTRSGAQQELGVKEFSDVSTGTLYIK